jgi:hypothetical protein
LQAFYFTSPNNEVLQNSQMLQSNPVLFLHV